MVTVRGDEAESASVMPVIGVSKLVCLHTRTAGCEGADRCGHGSAAGGSVTGFRCLRVPAPVSYTDSRGTVAKVWARAIDGEKQTSAL